MKKKYSFTLLEIMIVIFLIGIIGSIIGYNMTGTLDRGKAFKSEQAQARLQDMLELQLAEGVSENEICNNTKTIIENIGIVKNVNDFINDGWNKPFHVEIINGQVQVTSEKLNQYHAKHNKKNSEG